MYLFQRFVVWIKFELVLVKCLHEYLILNKHFINVSGDLSPQLALAMKIGTPMPVPSVIFLTQAGFPTSVHSVMRESRRER